MESKALVRLEPLGYIDIWNLPKGRRKEMEALERARKTALDALLRHDLALVLSGSCAVVSTVFAVIGMVALIGLLPTVAASLVAYLATIECLYRLKNRDAKVRAYREAAPSPRLSLQAGMEQELIDAGFLLNDDVSAWNTSAMIAGSEDVGDGFRGILSAKRERIAERLAAHDAMLDRYRLTATK